MRLWGSVVRVHDRYERKGVVLYERRCLILSLQIEQVRLVVLNSLSIINVCWIILDNLRCILVLIKVDKLSSSLFQEGIEPLFDVVRILIIIILFITYRYLGNFSLWRYLFMLLLRHLWNVCRPLWRVLLHHRLEKPRVPYFLVWTLYLLWPQSLRFGWRRLLERVPIDGGFLNWVEI